MSVVRLLAAGLALALAGCGAGAPVEPAIERPPSAERAAVVPDAPSEGEAPDAAPIDEAARLLREGRYDEALARYADREPDEATVRAMARAHLARGRVEEAIDVLTDFLVRSPSLAVSVDLGEALLSRGRAHEARGHLMRAIEAYNDDAIAPDDVVALVAVGRAAKALGSPKDANDAFREAGRRGAGHEELELAWARLFLDAHAPDEAKRSLELLLRRDPSHPDALVLLAEVRFELGAPTGLVHETLEKALAVNPSHVGARVCLAGLALRHRKFADARRELELALAVNPNDLGALSTLAALEWSLDREAELRDLERRVLALHPSYGAFYERIAEFAEYGHRYAEGVALAERALLRSPNDPRALSRRGVNLLRLAREAEGRRDLEAAFRRDPFDVRVYNLLELYDRTIEREYQTFEKKPFTLRMHTSERPMLERHVPKLLDEAYRAMAARYRFEPKRPIQFELYADADDFAVRTSGLPGLGLQGVCFGHVVTAVSPKAGPYNWGQILWHELAHVFHLQLSKHRVPRWFTEGLAEHEAERAPHGFVRALDHEVFAMLASGRIPSFENFDALFFEARSMEELVVAYAVSAEAATFLSERFGPGALRAFLVGFGEGAEFAELVPRVLRVTVAALDEAFREHLRAKLARFEGQFVYAPWSLPPADEAAKVAAASPGDASLAGRHAASLLAEGKQGEARRVAERAIALDAHEPYARFVLARLSVADRPAAAETHLEALLARVDGVEPRLMLATILLRADHLDEAEAQLRRAAELDPMRRGPWRMLRDVAARKTDRRAELEALERYAALEIHDRQAHLALLERALEAEDYERLAIYAERAVFVSPHAPRVHEARLLAWAALGRAKEAREALTDLRLAATVPRQEILVYAAEALERKGERRAAAEVRAAIDAAGSARP